MSIVTDPSPSRVLRGVGWALLTICLWSGWAIVTRLGVTQHFSAFDIAFMRYTTAGFLLLPVALRNLPALRAAKPRDVALMVLGAGAPYGLITGLGFELAPAAHSVLIPGTMPLWVALLAALVLGERFARARLIGLAIILVGALGKLLTSAGEHHNGYLLADALFLLSSLLWATYTVSVRRSGISPLVATAFVAVGSMLVMIPVYGAYQFMNPHPVPVSQALFQVLYQGVFTSIISLIAYNRAIAYLGASRTAAFAALVPGMVLLLAIPLLDEWPSATDILLATTLSIGVLLATGLRLRLPGGARPAAA